MKKEKNRLSAITIKHCKRIYLAMAFAHILTLFLHNTTHLRNFPKSNLYLLFSCTYINSIKLKFKILSRNGDEYKKISNMKKTKYGKFCSYFFQKRLNSADLAIEVKMLTLFSGNTGGVREPGQCK